MSEFIINGPSKLRGEVKISGSKNAALPIICATLLARGKSVIENVPDIADIRNLLLILESVGAKTKLENNVCEIDATNIINSEPDHKLVKHIRASILLIGPLLARCNEVKIAHPGGCFIGARPVGTHFKAFENLGAKIIPNEDCYHLRTGKLIGKKIILDEISVTATENIIMAAVLAEGETEIRLAATEPHVVDLCEMLVKMGAKIEGIGSHFIKILGVKKLESVEYTLIPDQIEAGTYALAAAATKSELSIKGFIPEHHDIFLKKLAEVNVNFEIVEPDVLNIKPTTLFKATSIRTDIWPNFPSDLQAPFAILLTQAEGTSEIYETMFEGRLNYLNELSKMGANCAIRNSHQASITGPTPLYGTKITTLDLRAGATLIIAALLAEGESLIENAEIIDRGYEKIEEKLQNLGVSIERVELVAK